jgi:sensor histidine kinase YesM
LERGKNIFPLLYQLFLKARLYHFVFWIVYVIVVALAVQPGHNPKEWVIYSSFILFFHGIAAYFNSYFLVTRFLYTRQIRFYTFSLLLTIVSVCFPISIIIHKLVRERDIKNIVWSWNFFLVTFLAVLFTVVLIMVLKLLKNWYDEEQAKKQLLQVNLETELKFLKTQINPHFLFNSLNNLYALTLKKSDTAPEVVLRLSNILRYVLYETGEGEVPLAKEIQYLKDYIDLEQIRLGNRVDIRFEIEGETENKVIEPMLFLTFVENSFKHGAAMAIEHGWVNIKLSTDAKKINFTIANSKNKQMPNEMPHQVGGIGLENLQKRLDLLYPNKYILNLSETEESFTVDLTLNNEPYV